MSDKSCKIVAVSQFGENQCTEVDFCSSSTSSEDCAGVYTNEIALSQLKEELFQSGDVNIEQSSNVHVGQKTSYENCNFRVIQYLNDVSEISTIQRDTNSEFENKTSHFQKSNTDIKNKSKLPWIRKDVRHATTVFGVFLILIIASVLLAMFLNAIFLPTTESETIETTTPEYENISTSSFPTTTDAPRKNKCPVDGQLSTSRIDLVSESAEQQKKLYDRPLIESIVKRRHWYASEYEYEPIELEIPHYVIVSHTLQQPCNISEECIKRVQSLQKFDRQERNLDDIRYNFLIGGDGLIYEGRGWRVVGQHTDNYNNRSLGIAFIMNSNKHNYDSRQGGAFRWLLEEAVQLRIIPKGYKLIGRCQVIFSTDSPGRYIFLLLQKHDHWMNSSLVS